MTMDDPLERCQSENHHLKETIAVLRAELEKHTAALEERLDKELSAHRDQMRHLQGTIAALRAELEARKP